MINLYINFKVCVKCFTFNHSMYVEEAMSSFTMQQTNFPFVCCIVDDASPDGEQEKIKTYMGLHFEMQDASITQIEENDDYYFIFSQCKDNKNCYFAVYLLKYNHYSIKKPKRTYLKEWEAVEYQAYCEGDDYWVDQTKLQKQVDILDKNPQYALCHHNMYYETAEGRKLRIQSIPQTQTLIDLAKANYIQTATVLFRNPSYSIIPDSLNGRHIYYHFIFMRICEQGDVYYLEDPMSVYRFHEGGMYSETSLFQQYRMTVDNINLMLSWYEDKNSDVTKALRQRLRKATFQHIASSIKKMEFKSAFQIFHLYNKSCK